MATATELLLEAIRLEIRASRRDHRKQGNQGLALEHESDRLAKIAIPDYPKEKP